MDTKLTTWWNEECDRDLIIGFRKFGFDSRDLIQDDDTLIFSKLIEDDNEMLEKEEDESLKALKISYELPSSNAIDKRIKVLIGVFDKQNQAKIQEEQAKVI